MYHVPGIRYDTAAVRSTWYVIPPVPGTRIFINTSAVFYFGKKNVLPARTVILIHGSDLCMHEEQPAKAARPKEAMAGRLLLLLSLLLLLRLPLLPASPLLQLCCYRHRTDNVRR